MPTAYATAYAYAGYGTTSSTSSDSHLFLINQIEFMKLMDMEDQLQSQKTAASIQGQSALLGLIGGAGNYLQSQGINYPTTTPSGTIPQAPAMNQGTQLIWVLQEGLQKAVVL
jgi:hypothetical protein